MNFIFPVSLRKRRLIIRKLLTTFMLMAVTVIAFMDARGSASTNLTLTNSLLSYWNFNGTNPNSYTPDGGSLSYPLRTGNDGRGPVNSGSVVSGVISNAIGFGSNGNQGLYIPSGNFPMLTTFTITAWEIGRAHV